MQRHESLGHRVTGESCVPVEERSCNIAKDRHDTRVNNGGLVCSVSSSYAQLQLQLRQEYMAARLAVMLDINDNVCYSVL